MAASWRRLLLPISIATAVALAASAWLVSRRRSSCDSPQEPTIPESEAPRNVEPPPVAVASVQASVLEVSFQENPVSSSIPQREEVFSSHPEDDEDLPLQLDMAATAANATRILEVQLKAREGDPSVVHPACVGFEFVGRSVEVPHNPQLSTPVLLGEWYVESMP